MLTKFLAKITDYQNAHPEKKVWGLFVSISSLEQ